jgi:hypothetical protein
MRKLRDTRKWSWYTCVINLNFNDELEVDQKRKLLSPQAACSRIRTGHSRIRTRRVTTVLFASLVLGRATPGLHVISLTHSWPLFLQLFLTFLKEEHFGELWSCLAFLLTSVSLWVLHILATRIIAISEIHDGVMSRLKWDTWSKAFTAMWHTALMMGTEMVSETSVIFNQLTRLIAREDFIKMRRFRCHFEKRN